MAANYTLGQKLSYTGVNNLKNHNAGASPPATATAGEGWFDTTYKQLNLYDGSAWVPHIPIVTVANGTVACVLTASSGPTGAQTAVQGWLRINISGTYRYVPYW